MGSHHQIRLMTPEEMLQVRRDRKLFHRQVAVTDPDLQALRATVIDTGDSVASVARDLGIPGHPTGINQRLNEAFGTGWRDKARCRE